MALIVCSIMHLLHIRSIMEIITRNYTQITTSFFFLCTQNFQIQKSNRFQTQKSFLPTPKQQRTRMFLSFSARKCIQNRSLNRMQNEDFYEEEMEIVIHGPNDEVYPLNEECDDVMMNESPSNRCNYSWPLFCGKPLALLQQQSAKYSFIKTCIVIITACACIIGCKLLLFGDVTTNGRDLQMLQASPSAGQQSVTIELTDDEGTVVDFNSESLPMKTGTQVEYLIKKCGKDYYYMKFNLIIKGGDVIHLDGNTTLDDIMEKFELEVENVINIKIWKRRRGPSKSAGETHDLKELHPPRQRRHARQRRPSPPPSPHRRTG